MAEQMLIATWALVAATALLVGATALYAVHTWRIAKRTADAAQSARQSAAAAERSAKAAEEVVELERERQREPARPEVRVWLAGGHPSPTDPGRRAVSLWVQNVGPGDALDVSFSCRVEHDGAVHSSAVDRPPPKRIQPDSKPRKDAVISYPNVRGAVRVVCICHYTDTYGTSARPRVYHSVFDDKDGTFPSSYCRPDQPLCSAYAEICRACRGAE